MKEGCEASSGLTFSALASMLPCDLPKVSLPVQREYVNIQLSMVRVLLQILECHVEEEKASHDHEKTKGHVQKVSECGCSGHNPPYECILVSQPFMIINVLKIRTVRKM